MDHRFRMNAWPWYARLPTKWTVFALTVLVVCFPYPTRLREHLRHWRDPNALVEPDAPTLQPLVDELRSELGGNSPSPETMRTVERFVLRRIPYEWDWNTWGMADYLPTVAEVLEKGREDCDGRAVVAASLLRSCGFEATIVTDFAHVWVKTDHGEAMGPGKRKAVIATEKGLQIQFRALTELPRALAYGIAVFPLIRELIVIGVAWLLLLRPGSGVGACVIMLAALNAGLSCLRWGGADYLHPVLSLQWLGVAMMLASIFVPPLRIRRRRGSTAQSRG
jgi:hypothetical protein